MTTDTVSVKDFGAVGDGVSDETAAIQAALDAGVKKVVIPDGTFIVSNLTAMGHSLLNVLVRAEDLVWNGGLVQGVDGAEDCVGLNLDKAGPYPNSWTAKRALIQGVKIRPFLLDLISRPLRVGT